MNHIPVGWGEGTEWVAGGGKDFPSNRFLRKFVLSVLDYPLLHPPAPTLQKSPSSGEPATGSRASEEGY